MSDVVARITARYKLDTASGRKAFDRSEIPISYDAITTQWLTDVLCRSHPGAVVTEFELGEVDNGVSNRRRIFLRYNEQGRTAGLPSSIFCKAAHGLQNRLLFALSGCGHAEVTFYNTVRPQLHIEAPDSLWAKYDPESGLAILLLKDMTDAEFCRHFTPITFARATDMVELLATLHGTFYKSKPLLEGKLDFLTWPQYWDNNIRMGMEEFTNRGFLAAEEVIPARLFKRHEEIWPATMNSVHRHLELPRTLTHSDVHLKNWFIAPSGRMGLNDWQNTCIGHWSRDFAYSVSTALTVENRRAWERQLLEIYLSKFHECGGARCSFEEMWLNYRQQLLSALAYWTVTLTPSPSMPDMQPRDTTIEFIRRMAHAIDDHESLESFGR